MKRKLVLILTITTFIFLSGCKETNDSKTQEPEIDTSEEERQPEEEQDAVQKAEQQGEGQPDTQQPESQETGEKTFGFENLSDQLFEFCSGAGGWSTELMINSDGTFEGNHHDSDMGDVGEEYPNGTLYYCSFTGKFTDLEQVDAFTWKMKLASLEFEDEPEMEEIIDGVRNISSTAYGLDGGDEFYLYLPGSKLEQLPEEFLWWAGYNNLENTTETELPFYGLYNIKMENGFYSYEYKELSLGEQIAMEISDANERAAEAEAKLQSATTQGDMNMASAELFQVWDDALNNVWNMLQAKLDEETMEALREEEREWIASKEAQVKEAGAGSEGGSIQPLLEATTAAELTKERVYELEKYANE